MAAFLSTGAPAECSPLPWINEHLLEAPPRSVLNERRYGEPRLFGRHAVEIEHGLGLERGQAPSLEGAVRGLGLGVLVANPVRRDPGLEGP